MSIPNIVCRSGVGPTANIPFFVTHGLGPFDPVAPVTTTERKPTYGSKGSLEDERELFLKQQNQIALALLLDEF